MSNIKIGTEFTTRGKHPRICQVVDIHKTYNYLGDLVKTRYVAVHDFMGQAVIERDIPATTIKRGMINGTN